MATVTGAREATALGDFGPWPGPSIDFTSRGVKNEKLPTTTGNVFHTKREKQQITRKVLMNLFMKR